MATTRKDLRLLLGGVGYIGDMVGDSTNEMHVLFAPDDKNDAINRAIEYGGKYWIRRNEDESIVVVANTFQYSLASVTPAVIRSRGIDYVEIETSSGPYATLNHETWWLRDDNGVLYLQFDSVPGAAGDKIRLIYQVLPATLATDAATLDPDSQKFINYICTKASAFLYQKKANFPDEPARDHWQLLANQANQNAMLLLNDREGVPQPRPTYSAW